MRNISIHCHRILNEKNFREKITPQEKYGSVAFYYKEVGRQRTTSPKRRKPINDDDKYEPVWMSSSESEEEAANVTTDNEVVKTVDENDNGD